MAFKNTVFIDVGGSTWGKIIKHVQGTDLTPQQQYLGNQWSPDKTSSHVATFTLLVLGRNDGDQFQRKLDETGHGACQHHLHWLEGKIELNAPYTRIIAKIDKVITFLEGEL